MKGDEMEAWEGDESPESLPKKGKRKSPGVWPDDEFLREIVFKKAGIVNQIADAIGVDRRSVQRRIKTNRRFREWVSEAREHLLDASEAVIVKKISAGNLTAAIFTLKCHGKGRGWVERQEVTGANGMPLGGGEDPRKISEDIRAAMSDPSFRKRYTDLWKDIDARTSADPAPSTEPEDAVTRH